MNFEKIVPLAARRKRDTLALDGPKTDRLRARVREARERSQAAGIWTLECSAGADGALKRTPIEPLPFRVGRGVDQELVLASLHVSNACSDLGITVHLPD